MSTCDINNPLRDSNRFVFELETIFKKLENGEFGESKIVRLRLHKRKPIIDAVCILPEATGTAYTVENVHKGFVYNGQLDPSCNSVLSLEYLLHTYRGNIKGTSLENRSELVRTFFEEMVTNGCITENSFEINNIPKDKDSHGRIVERSNDPKQENCHRAKILSSNKQVRDRRHLIDKKRMSEYEAKKAWFHLEEKK